ncbi:MAG: Ig-like domain-containing protein, partial [Lachnospiraceae bacterium]|nr:Ig-like domain-containing protein [Lachnospiraceae bacterium]
MKVRRILPVILAGTLLITTVNYPQAVYAEDILGDENSGAYTVELSNEVLLGEKITEPAGIPDISGTLTNEDILIKEEEPAANGILTDEDSLNNPEEIIPEVSEEIILNVNGDTSAVPEQEEVSAENSTEISGYVETSEAVPEEMNVKEFPPEGTGEEAPVRAITLSPSQKTIRADEGEFELKVSTYPVVATGAGIECRPLDDNVTVSKHEDDSFLINSNIEELPKGKKSVKSRVEVRATDGYGAKAYCDITMVKGIDVIEISAPKDQDLLAVGKKLKLNAAVEPKDAYTGEIIWTSSDESVLKVDNKGNVTAVGTGRAEITATDNV